jgi:hypothetical protein
MLHSIVNTASWLKIKEGSCGRGEEIATAGK